MITSISNENPQKKKLQVSKQTRTNLLHSSESLMHFASPIFLQVVVFKAQALFAPHQNVEGSFISRIGNPLGKLPVAHGIYGFKAQRVGNSAPV